ncbi:MAG TPA: SPFH domain-containing protein [Candidatus Dormibacteraeota bacterium]|jgi:membrane protease subunit (stomatin/prohibitin family)
MPDFFPSPRENIAVPDARKGQIVFKWPDVNIRRYSNAIVAPDEVAVFMYQGEVKGTLPPGRHALDATEIPFLGFFADHLSGGNLYRVEIYFVGSREYPDLKFGGRIDNVQDPVTGLVVSLGVYGEYSLKVTDPSTLLTNLTGTVDVTDNDAITDWVAQQLVKVLRTDVTQHVVSKGWPVLGLAAYVPEVEAEVIAASAQQLAGYGLSVARMGNFTISLGDEDEAQLKTLARDTAYSRLAGSFQQYAAGELQLGAGRGMEKGGAGVSGAFIGAGLGLGGQATQPPAVGATPPSPSGNGAAAVVTCPACATANTAGAKYCTNCGAALPAADPRVCTGCGAPLPAGAKFCAGCGRAVDSAAAAAPSAATSPRTAPEAPSTPPEPAAG